MTFVEGYKKGIYKANDIDKFLFNWHNSQEDTLVFEALGISEEDYNVWLMDKTKFNEIFDKY